MSYDLTKRLSSLKAQTDAEVEGRHSYWGVFFQSLLGLACLAFFISQLHSAHIAPQDEASKTFSKWQNETKLLVEERREYLNNSILFGSLRSKLYLTFANNVIELFGVGEPNPISDTGKILDFESWGAWSAEAFAGIILRAAFIIFACFHLWVLALGLGYLIFRYILVPRKTSDILGVLNRNRGPFYSGIYGPLKPNKSASGTDLSSPGLACPQMILRHEALKHPLAKTLNQYGAMNETNINLIRVILAYKDYPATVDEERIAEESEDAPPAVNSFRTNEEGTIESRAMECLEQVLSAHKALVAQYSKLNDAPVESDYLKHFSEASEKAKSLSQFAAKLFMALTPSRARALSKIPAEAVASAYLAIEAGKCLVFRREGTVFFPISRFPHLQARAVIQSLNSYHQEYSGDLRLTIRQAIICSRRHGDFGRAFLPVHMSSASRGLRDWLEILFSNPKRREGFGYLSELDAHLEEIHLNFRKEFIKRLVSGGMQERAKDAEAIPLRERLGKGIAYKSVVLVPLRELVELTLSGISPGRLRRVSELIQVTKKLQASLSISARLPGFKRQAEEAGKGAYESGGITREMAEKPENAPLLSGWLIIRRMLTRYNWLSTRVGDSAVPVDGLITAIVLDRSVGERPDLIGLDSAVPLRQRRFKELLGPKWEAQYYSNNPSSNDIDIYELIEEFHEGYSEINEQVSKGLFDRAKVGGRA